MRTFLLTLSVLFILVLNSKAQTWTPVSSPTPGLRLDPSTSSLIIRNNLLFTPTSGDRVVNFGVSSEVARIQANATTESAYMEMFGNNHPDNDRKGQITFVSGISSNQAGTKFNFFNRTATGWDALMRIQANGKVIIGDYGTSHWTSTKYRLYVQDGIITEQLKVALRNTNDWSDYVFKPNYKLRTLKQVEQYINTYKHLPDVPSAEQVKEEGIDMATMDATLLRKIEELTLYTIQLQKELDAMRLQLKILEQKK